MLFSSITFLYYFLPVVLILYFITPNKYKNLILFISSIVFYFYGEPKYIFLMLFSIISAYIHGILIDKYRNTKYSKIFLISSIIVNLLLLGFFKYIDFIITNINLLLNAKINLLQIALPIGISFYTFQTMSYTIDVYRNNAKVQKNLLKLATYVSLFPQLIAGPIVRYSSIEKELQKRTHSFENFAIGIRRFIIGLSKKILIANLLGNLANILIGIDEKSVMLYWLYAIACSMQIYFDFSGYSDMAIGLGKIFGFNFLENFNYPYISKSITEFWRRWHISLGTWFKDYVYIPLGGNRGNKIKLIRNILIVWLLTGLWHGAAWNFVVWGALFAVILIIEKIGLYNLLNKIPSIFSRMYVLFIVMVSFIIFNAGNIGQAVNNILGLFGNGGIPFITDATAYYLSSYAIILIVGIIGCTPLIKNLFKKCTNKFKGIINILEPIVLVILLIVCTAYIVDGSFNPFLYFRF